MGSRTRSAPCVMHTGPSGRRIPASSHRTGQTAWQRVARWTVLGTWFHKLRDTGFASSWRKLHLATKTQSRSYLAGLSQEAPPWLVAYLYTVDQWLLPWPGPDRMVPAHR